LRRILSIGLAALALGCSGGRRDAKAPPGEATGDTTYGDTTYGAASTPATDTSATPPAPTDTAARHAPPPPPPGEELDVTAFNRRIERAAEADSPWVRSPAFVAIQYTGDSCECAKSSLEVQNEPERFDEAEVIVVHDGLMDDSIRGYRYRLAMKRDERGVWSLTSIRRAWRCWPGRGHEDYSTERCL
jgi:hypothetical protein